MMKNFTRLVAALSVALASTMAMSDSAGILCRMRQMPYFVCARSASCKVLAQFDGLARQTLRHRASMDEKSAAEISNWLKNNAAGARRSADVPRDNRITNSAWFASEHRKVGSAVWLRASIIFAKLYPRP